MALTLDPRRCAIMAMDYQNRIIVVTDGCASNTDDNHHFFVNTILPSLGTAATASEVIAALR
jgi:hypothetical protein